LIGDEQPISSDVKDEGGRLLEKRCFTGTISEARLARRAGHSRHDRVISHHTNTRCARIGHEEATPGCVAGNAVREDDACVEWRESIATVESGAIEDGGRHPRAVAHVSGGWQL
jgi:hypothetical protein